MSLKSAPPRLALLLSTFLTASSLLGCAATSSTREVQTVAASAASLKVDVPSLARESCAAAELPPKKASEIDYQVFGLRQSGKLQQCEFKRALGVQAMDMHNAYVDKLVTELRPATGWERIFGKRR